MVASSPRADCRPLDQSLRKRFAILILATVASDRRQRQMCIRDSGLLFRDKKNLQDLEFLRVEGNIEVYLDKQSGDEVYLGRTRTPEALFQTACEACLLYTSPSPRDLSTSRMPSSA